MESLSTKIIKVRKEDLLGVVLGWAKKQVEIFAFEVKIGLNYIVLYEQKKKNKRTFTVFQIMVVSLLGENTVVEESKTFNPKMSDYRA